MISCVLIEDLVRGVEIYGTFACLGHSLINHVISYLGKYCYNSAYWLDAVSVRGRGGEAWLQACTNNRKGIIIYGDVADVP